ncbi:MAG: T9SS type A sorting domain-containing protein [Bacteroidota bacterium]
MKRLVCIFCLFCALGWGFAQEGNLQEPNPVSKVKLFPNPATNVINVLGLKNSDQAHIVISDTYGTPVLQHKWRIKNNAINIPIAHLDSGIYLISINCKEQKVREKFYKQ